MKSQSGYVFTNLDEGTKSFVVDLVGEDGQVRTFTFFIPVPGLKIDHRKIDFEGLYPVDRWKNFEDEKNFITYLQVLPCCTEIKKGTECGDPLNLILLGNGVGEAPVDAPRDNLTGDPYFTDGLRAVLWLSSQPVAFEKV